ncbi:MAG TPA: alpha/beta hydrolase, partial [Flavisolibacter sp.]|nr:alpha/beta hydrolase [Flavisolibacter sp.]
MTEAIFTLKDDRKLSYAIYGPADGKPVLYYHGTPSSRREILLLKSYGIDFDELLHRSGLKLIAPDRGSLTTFHAQRTFSSFAADAVELLQSMGVQNFSVLCWSGGGPYALATAHNYPGIVEGVYILCGIAKPFDKEVLQQMGLNKWYFVSARNTPLLLRSALAILRQTETTSLPNRKLTGLSVVDYSLLQHAVKEVAACTVKESIRKGTKTAVQEAGLYFHPFDFSIKTIQQPIHYWWGTKDMAVVELHAREIEQKARHPVMHYREGEGHLSLYINCFAEALEAI